MESGYPLVSSNLPLAQSPCVASRNEQRLLGQQSQSQKKQATAEKEASHVIRLVADCRRRTQMVHPGRSRQNCQVRRHTTLVPVSIRQGRTVDKEVTLCFKRGAAVTGDIIA